MLEICAALVGELVSWSVDKAHAPPCPPPDRFTHYSLMGAGYNKFEYGRYVNRPAEMLTSNKCQMCQE
jgi:hypothetical protein